MAAVFNVILFWCGSAIFSAPKLKQQSQEDLLEIAWVETEETMTTAPAPEVSAVETFSEIVMPPLEIPHTVFEPLPKFETEPPSMPVKPQPVEEPAKVETPPVEKVEEKPEEKPEDKLKVIAKVYPKDVIPQFMKTGVVRKPLTLAEEKMVLSVTITVEGKVRDVKIISGGGDDLINFIAISSAGGWIFEPYLDAEGTPQELKTQLEFTAEDFVV